MPIYEYRCDEGHTFEVMQRMSDDPIATCETCSARVHKVFHPVAVHFKGSGFYNTDYGTRKRQREQKESGEGGKEGGKDSKTTSDSKSSDASAKSESKSETKSEGKTSSASKSD
jgi:putative FmdB family regulatory protein